MKRTTSSRITADITSEQLILTPERDGICGIPAVSRGAYTTNWHALPPHTHADCIEMCLCTRGSLVFECGGVRETLLPDNVFLSQPTDLHHLVTNNKGMRMYWLFFRYPKRGEAVLGLSSAETAALVRRLREIPAHVFSVPRGLRVLFGEFFSAYESLPRGAFRSLTLRTLALRILLLVVANAENRPTLPSLATISRIAEILRGRPSHRFTIAELAAHAKMSPSHFTSLFRRVMGLPPFAYLANHRLEEARRRLIETDDPISDIAESLGFASPQHLATQFRKTYGSTPSAIRRG